MVIAVDKGANHGYIHKVEGISQRNKHGGDVHHVLGRFAADSGGIEQSVGGVVTTGYHIGNVEDQIEPRLQLFDGNFRKHPVPLGTVQTGPQTPPSASGQ